MAKQVTPSRVRLSFLATALLLAVASATRDTLTLSTVHPKTDSHQNECMGDSIGGDCVGTDQIGAGYSYEPSTDGDKLVAEGLEIGSSIDGFKSTEDHLGEREQLMYKSKEPSFWRASDQDTLKQVLIVHRHGDRTPINLPPKDPLANEPFWQFHGLGQLTNRGKARLHLLGKIVRHRYNVFLNGSVNKNLRKTRASGALRCIESAQVFLSSFLSLDTRTSSDASKLIWDLPADKLAQLWQPAAIQTLAAKFDGLMNEGADCKNLLSEYEALDHAEESQRLMEEFKHEADVLKKELDFEVDHFYKWFWAGSVIEVERSYFPDKMKPALMAIYDRLQQASDRALVVYQSSFKIRRLRAGLLINDIVENMDEIRKSSQSPFAKKFVQYSGHDITLIFLLGLVDNIEKFAYRPDYASNMIFELHQDQEEWFIKIFYMPHVPSKPFELHMDACEKVHPRNRCTLDKFTDLMQKYRVASWSDWMQECDNPLSSFNPYDQNL